MSAQRTPRRQVGVVDIVPKMVVRKLLEPAEAVEAIASTARRALFT